MAISGGDTAVVTQANGVLTATTGATYAFASGGLQVNFTSNQPDAFYQPIFTWESSESSTVGRIESNSVAVGVFRINFHDVKDNTVITDQISVIRLSILRLSQ